MNSKTDSFTYTVEPFDTDFSNNLSWSVLGRRILSTATFHAQKRGFDQLIHEGTPYLWVLSRLVVEIDRWPAVGNTYTITTWVKDRFRQFTTRYFDITDSDGQPYGRALTIWAMINAHTRQPADLNVLFGDTFDHCFDAERPCNIQRSPRIRVESTLPVSSRTARYSDIDTNGHVNSIRYIEYLLDSFPQQKYQDETVTRLEINYCAEGHITDRLHVFIDQAKADTYAAEIRRATDNVTVCKSCITFRKNKRSF